MTYKEKIKAHLKIYKQNNFKEIEDGEWKKNKKTYPHIFPQNKWKLNLLTTYGCELEKYREEKKIKNHTDFHHLNSSQAMCLNFFYPLIKEKELDIILKFIGFDNESINYENVCFEKKSNDKTCFDFFIETVSGKNIFFEIKYTEQKFGQAKNNESHRNKFNNIYNKKLKVIKEEFHTSDNFLKNYQVLRNLICIDKNSYVCFLYPRENNTIRKQSERVNSNFLKEEFLKNFKNITWEDLVSFTEKQAKNENIKKQLKEFKDKYRV